MKSFIVVGSLSVFFALSACSPPVSNNPDASPDANGSDAAPSDASASGIGPMGGTVQGPNLMTSIEVPSGALTTTVPLAIELTSDETPLPEGALRVGPQFKITPDGTAFARPVRWTLPFDRTDVETLGSQQSSVKVWVRTASGWMLTEPVAVGDGTVTIEVNQATTAAAGVRLQRLLLGCGGATQPACVEPVVQPPTATCTGEFCLQMLVDPATQTRRIQNIGHVAVRDSKVYFLTGGIASRIGLDGTGLVTGGAIPNGFAPLDIGLRTAVDRDGNFWTGVYRHTFTAPAMVPQIANLPAGFGLNSVAVSGLPVGQFADAAELATAPDGSIHAYHRVVQRVGEQPLVVNDVRMERWTFNPNLSVTGPTILAQGVGRPMTMQPDAMNPGGFWVFGRLKPAFASGILSSVNGIDGARLLRLDAAGMITASLDAPVMANGIVRALTTDGLCPTAMSCTAQVNDNHISIRGTEIIAPTHPSITTSPSLQQIDGASPMFTRTAVNLPMMTEPVVNIVHDSTGGVWLFTRLSAQQVWHFNRMTNRLTPIGLGGRNPFGITSDGGDGIVVMVNAPAGGSPTGLVRVRRLMM